MVEIRNQKNMQDVITSAPNSDVQGKYLTPKGAASNTPNWRTSGTGYAQSSVHVAADKEAVK